jgi:hypothetical protein
MRNTLLKIASVLLLAPTVALAGGPVAQPSCAQVICLSPDHGKAPPAECIPVRSAYFVIRVFDPLYDPGATADARHAFLRTCLTAQSSDLQIIKLKYGRLYADPITF